MEQVVDVKTASGSVTVKELTVAEIRNWWRRLQQSEEADPVDELLLDGITLGEVLLMTDLDSSTIEGLTPSELEKIVEKCKEVNPRFFAMLRMSTGVMMNALRAASAGKEEVSSDK